MTSYNPDVADDARTTPAKGRASALPRRRTLLVIIGDDVRVHPLPLAGTVTIGRGAGSDLVIDEPSISRTHLTLHLAPGEIAVADRGSANGSSVRGVRLPAEARVRVGINEAVVAGDVTLVVQEIGAPADEAPEPVRAPAVAREPSMAQLYDLAARVARGTISVLVHGETGSGKEHLCELLHAKSARAAGPLVRVNCAVLADSLVESELFGHEKGAFTGAVAARAGYIEAAHGGTLMLDEVGELPLSSQSKLLRVLEERAVTRIGSTMPKSVDVRFVAATNRDLEAESAAGRFRADLFFRLAGVVLQIPPLRARSLDIEALAIDFVRDAAQKLGRTPPRLSRDAIAALRAHAWPGNVRELRNVIERAVLVVEGDVVEPNVLALATPPPAAGDDRLADELARIERARIVEALEKCQGNQTRAAELLGMPRRTLIKRLEAYEIARPRKK
jgi:DNA-binding NtrC family response regulator